MTARRRVALPHLLKARAHLMDEYFGCTRIAQPLSESLSQALNPFEVSFRALLRLNAKQDFRHFLAEIPLSQVLESL